MKSCTRSETLVPAAIAVCSALAPTIAFAQSQDAAPSTDTPSASATSPAQGVQTFTPEDFAQFSPRNALEMVERIPGFAITQERRGERGLGQADQNVIVNGERFSSKSDSVRDQLQRIPASDVVRIEIVDGTSLDIPGLSGQVANVIQSSSGDSGQFRWNTGFRPHNAGERLFGGEISYSGADGALSYTISLENRNNRFGADGPTLITDGSGDLIEAQTSQFAGMFDDPTLTTNFTYKAGPETTINLNLSYGEDFFGTRETEIGVPATGPVRERLTKRRTRGPEYEIGGDIEFPLGPGTMKLIGLERFERDNSANSFVDNFDDGSPDTGVQFDRINEEGERIARFEYGWPMLNADWQLSGEAAFNRLNRRSSLFELSPAGVFEQIAFPGGTGGVTEDRYEAILSYTRQLSPELSLQLSAGGEYSKIEQTGSAANSRTFQRPKGSVSVSWKPSSDFDISVEAQRRVGQLSFGDFLASVSLVRETENGGNNELEPEQSWDIDIEANKSLGAWGSIKVEFGQSWIEDFVDFFPLGDEGEARGNIGSAKRTLLELTGTINGEPIGWKGARLELSAIKRWMSVTDPFTAQKRVFSSNQRDLLEMDFRHDVPGSDWAWGAGLFTEGNTPYFRRFEIGRDFEGPSFFDLFIEHKDVMGLTVNATYGNFLGARNKFERTVFDGPRPDSPLLFREVMDRRIGPIFQFSVSGNF